MARSFFSQVSHYLGGQVLQQIAGLISFPTFTRVLTTAQYGLMSVVNSTIPMVMPFAKCGMSFASERFYAQYRAKGEENEFFSTTILFSLGWCLVFCGLYELVLGGALWLLPPSVLAKGATRTLLHLLMLVGAQIFLKAQLSVLLQITRAKQETLAYNTATTVETYLSLGLSLTLLFTMGLKLEWLFIGQMLATGTVLLYLLRRLSKTLRIRRSFYRKAIAKESLAFGTPMIWNEIAAVAQGMADRYVILFFLGEEAVGVYSVGFNVSMILIALTMVPVYATLGPVVFQKHAEGGEAAARAFLEPVGRWLLRLLFPLIAGVEATAAPLVVLLASSKYREAAVITSINFAGLVFWNAANVLGIAIMIAKQTRLHRNVVLMGTAVNIVLAIGLVQVWHIRGAAVAALITALLAAAVLCYRAYRVLPIRIWGSYLVPSIVASVAMYFAVTQIHFAIGWLTLAVRVALGIALYVPLLLAFDREARTDVRAAWAKIRERRRQIPS
ncbi:MAG: lipopolysaccharide biosynthesis protein [Deltaproteobacteria bacterium]|nr:lipopolysaccharide biosynthesis protein [Deltaproteobacteria bacterium]